MTSPIDTTEFARRFMERLIDLAAEQAGVPRIEVVRRYHTDAKFHTQVHILVRMAQHVLDTMDVQEEEAKLTRMEELQNIFMAEANLNKLDLLGLDEPPVS